MSTIPMSLERNTRSASERQPAEDSKKLTHEKHTKAMENAMMFRKWAFETLFENNPSVVMLVPQGRPGANYRDITNSVGGFEYLEALVILFSSTACWAFRKLSYLLAKMRINHDHLVAKRWRRNSQVSWHGQYGSGPSAPAVGTLSASGRPTELLTGRYVFSQHALTSVNGENKNANKAAL
ncbi:hypothetical protein F5Y19DRAFT_473911 [Xylariaceae sp. FL1651]|nr:hypothetical protein F5Y19DRAFT_473911 [Xylariaceae sp. FL1651]